MYTGAVSKGLRTRRRILDHAVRLVSAKGLDAVNIGPLAERLRMSKSGLFAHFGSKERLQIAALDVAADYFRECVVAPVLERPRGLAQIRTLFATWVDWAPRAGLPGGCPFVAAAAELDDQKGPVRDHLVDLQQQWFRFLERMARDARDNGELRADVDPRAFASELFALVLMHHWSRRLLRDRRATATARRAFAALVDRSRRPPRSRSRSRVAGR
jgi:AcrR family transcriptional regulator